MFKASTADREAFRWLRSGYSPLKNGKLTTYGLRDCDVREGDGKREGWHDHELLAFRRGGDAHHVTRHLGPDGIPFTYPAKLWAEHYCVRAKLLAAHRSGAITLALRAPQNATRILIRHRVPEGLLAEFRRRWPWATHEEEGCSYSVLFIRYTARQRVAVILDAFESVMGEGYKVEGRLTLWSGQDDDVQLVRRGDAVQLPRSFAEVMALPEVVPDDIVEHNLSLDTAHEPEALCDASCESIRFQVPEAFNDAALPSDLQRYGDYARYLFSTLRLKWSYWEADEQRWVHLNRDVLRQVIPKDVVYPLLGALIDGEWIERNDSYSVGNFSKSFRVHPRRDCGAKWVSVPCTNPKLVTKLKRWSRMELPVYQHLNQWLMKTSLDRGVLDVIREIESDALSSGSALQFTRNYELCQLIKAKQWQLSVCKQGRVHSVLTRLDRRLRELLLVDGQRIVWLDVRNSQPLIFGLVLKEYVSTGSISAMSPLLKARGSCKATGSHKESRRLRREAPRERPPIMWEISSNAHSDKDSEEK